MATELESFQIGRRDCEIGTTNVGVGGHARATIVMPVFGIVDSLFSPLASLFVIMTLH